MQRSEGGGAGRLCGTEVRGIVRGGAAARSHTPPPERSGAKNREGALQSPRAASGASGGGAGAQSATGGTGARAYARGGTHNDRGGNAIQTPRQNANPPRAHGARGLDGRATRTSERRGAWRPGASHHHKNAPSLLCEERARGDTQRPLIRKRGAERSAQRVCLGARRDYRSGNGGIHEERREPRRGIRERSERYPRRVASASVASRVGRQSCDATAVRVGASLFGSPNILP